MVARRQRNDERTKRFHVQRKTRGVDVAILDTQCRDNERKRNDDAELDRKYADMAAQVSLIVEERRLADEEQRLAELRHLKEDWDAHAELPKNNATKIAAAVDVENAGLASAQRLMGEDRESGRRKARQAAQMRSWTLEQMELKRQVQAGVQEEDDRFAAWEKHVNQQRINIEREEADALKQSEADLRDYRGRQAAERRARERDSATSTAEANAAEVARNMKDPILTESQYLHDDGRIRVDHFRGYTHGQTKRVYKENENVQAYRAAMAEEKADQEAAYASEMRNIQMLVNAAEFQAADAKRHELMLLKKDLEEQRDTERQRAADSRRDAFGAVSEGVLSGFGSSYR